LYSAIKSEDTEALKDTDTTVCEIVAAVVASCPQQQQLTEPIVVNEVGDQCRSSTTTATVALG